MSTYLSSLSPTPYPLEAPCGTSPLVAGIATESLASMSHSEGPARRLYRVRFPLPRALRSPIPVAVSSSLMEVSYGRLMPKAVASQTVPLSKRLYRVAPSPSQEIPIATVSRPAYKRAGAAVGGLLQSVLGGQDSQVHTGGRIEVGGRPVGTRRST